MNWHYVYNPSIWLPLFTALFFAALSIYSYRRRNVPGALPFAIATLFAVPWAVGSVMEYAAVDFAVKIDWVKFQTVWQLPAATAITCFVLEYVWPGRWLTRRNLILLSIAPLLILGLILVDDLHHLMWRSFSFTGTVVPQPGSASWIALAYGYGLGIINVIVFVWLFLHWPQQRWPVVVLLIGLLGGRVIYLLEKLYRLHGDLPLDILGIAFLCLMYAIALFGFQIFEPVPLARQMIINQLHTGILVLDAQERVASLNPAAERVLEMPVARAIGRPIRELLPACPDKPLADSSVTEVEFSLAMGQEPRYYTLAISQLSDWRGRDSGCLLLLRDVTEQKKAQAQIIKQEQVLATLQERERIARELHDSLGQVLGYASFQVEAAAKLTRDGQAQAAVVQLERLGSVIREAHADVREYIVNMRTAPSLEQPFFTVVKKYLESFTCSYDIQAHLTIATGLNGKTFATDVQLQLFRIVQEALSNVRKHSQARHVYVNFEAQDGRVCMMIQDDGFGFSSNNLETAPGQHFGLKFMQERALLLGGSLQIQSTPGKGTLVLLELPGKEL